MTQIPPAQSILPEVLQGSVHTQTREEEGEGKPGSGEHDLGALEDPGPLPVEVLESSSRVGDGGVRAWPNGWFYILRPTESLREVLTTSLPPGKDADQGSSEALAGRGCLVDDRAEAGPEGQEEVNG